MITELHTYTSKHIDPYRNIAIEEFLTMHTQEQECILYLWQNQHTVVIGRNQNCWKECRINALEEDGGHLARRLSGGGAVYHDLGNLNFTFCVRENNYDVDRQLEVIVRAVRMLGLEAEKTGRNDITVQDRKFSGNAFYRSNGFCYHHGTLLVDADLTALSRYLNVSREKLQTKGVDSVRARVVNLRALNPEITVEALRRQMVAAFEQVYGLRAQPFPEKRLDLEAIVEGERKFASWDWKYGRRLPFQYRMYRRFSWGDIELQFQVNRGLVQEISAYSDSMEHALVARLPGLWRGCRYEEQALRRALEAAGDTAEIANAKKADAECSVDDGRFAQRAADAEIERQMCEDIGTLIHECI